MHFRTRLAAVVSAAALATLAVSLPASASVPQAAGSPVYSKTSTGYQVTGRQFRFIATSFEVHSDALCSQIATASPQGAGAGVDLVTGTGADMSLGLSFVPSAAGCGLISPSMSEGGIQYWPQTGVIRVYPGNEVTLSLYYNQADTTTYGTVTNDSTGETQTATAAGRAVLYTQADAGAGFGPFTAPSSSFRAFAFSGTALTTYTGQHGTLSNLGTAHEQIMTSDGTSKGTVEANAPVLFNGGTQFGAWLRS